MLKQCRKYGVTVKTTSSDAIAAGTTPPVRNRAAADATGTDGDSTFLSAT